MNTSESNLNRLAEDIDSAYGLFGGAQSEVIKAARSIVEDDAANQPVARDNVTHMEQALNWYREAELELALSNAAYYPAGGTDEMLRERNNE